MENLRADSLFFEPDGKRVRQFGLSAAGLARYGHNVLVPRMLLLEGLELRYDPFSYNRCCYYVLFAYE